MKGTKADRKKQKGFYIDLRIIMHLGFTMGFRQENAISLRLITNFPTTCESVVGVKVV